MYRKASKIWQWIVLSVFSFLVLAAVLGTQTAFAGNIDNAKEYTDCMLLASRAATEALESALAWEKQGGGDAARHCKAVAMVNLGQYEDAALELERIAQVQPQIRAPIAAELFAQAAQVWIRAGNPQRALHDQNEGLKLQPNDLDLLIDRAMTYGNAGMYFEALDDLNSAIDINSSRADIYVLRSAAYRHLNNLDLAQDNIEQALKLDPNNPQGLLERGILKELKGDRGGAREDWLFVVQHAGGTPASDEAQRFLEKLDLKAE